MADPPTYRSGSTSVEAENRASSPEESAAALEFLQRLAAEISLGEVDLPCFPNIVVRISEALMDPGATADRIVTVVGAEPRLAARITQTANSAAFNATGKPVTELRSAITRVGHHMVQSIAISYAIQQMEHEESLRSIARELSRLWERSIAVASLCQLVAERTKVHTDVAFLTGLLHGIGSLYIMARAAVGQPAAGDRRAWLELLGGWQASIGKAILENWGFPEEMCDAVADQLDHDRRWKHDATLTDVMIVSLVLADALDAPEPRTVETTGINAFASVGLTPVDCEATLVRATGRIAAVHAALG